jgi:mycothiol synthase
VHRIELKRHLRPEDIAAVSGLLAAASHADGHAPLDEHAWLDLVQGGRSGFAGLVAWEDGHPHPVGYAQLSRDGHNWALEYAVDPHHRVPGNTVAEELVAAAADVVRAEGGGHVHLWVNQPRPAHAQIAASIGLEPGRSLYQMRRALPLDEHAAIGTRPFVPGQDEEAWLAVNNRAFDWHPEQGGWELATIEAREAQPWFDPAGFLLHEVDGRLAGFCWTKVHADHDPPLGEIYVIATDPDFAGHGLGRQLVLAGLDYLAGRGLGTAMLYVDAENRAAVKLYVDLGFEIDHLDRAFTGDIGVDPASNVEERS